MSVRTSSNALTKRDKNSDLYLASVQFLFRPEKRTSPMLTDVRRSCPVRFHKKAGIVPQL